MTTSAADRIELRNPDAYKAKLKAFVGDRDPLDVLAETPGILRQLVNRTSADDLRARPFEGKWTPIEIIGHMVDVEWVFGYRTRAIACDPKPQIIGMDQDRWVDVQCYSERDAAQLAQDFSALRRINLAFWHTLTPDMRKRVGVHSERGEESIETMLTMVAGHDGWHLDQIDRYLAAARS